MFYFALIFIFNILLYVQQLEKRKLTLFLFCRHRQPSSFSETEVVTDSENMSESNTDGFSDGNTENPVNDFDVLRARDSQFMNKSGATEKITTVCNEIKQRFQPDLTNTDDENVVWNLQIYI